jgi:hypothetical protein
MINKPLRIITSISCFLFNIVGGFFLYITWQHNPQCEFPCEGNINWLNWLPYGVISGFYAFIVSMLAGFILMFCYVWLRQFIQTK